jgi:hypothetical protein
VHADASPHRATRYGPAKRLEAKLNAEIAALLKRAEAFDAKGLPEQLKLPEELIRL